MSYEEKGQWVSLVITTVAVAAYAFLLISRTNGTPLQDVDYGPILLWTVGLGIVGTIVGRILLEIAKPSDGHASDVRDRDIGRFGEYVGGTILGIGMVVPFLLAIAETDHFWIANSMYFVFALAAIVGTTIKLIAYRRGF